MYMYSYIENLLIIINRTKEFDIRTANGLYEWPTSQRKVLPIHLLGLYPN